SITNLKLVEGLENLLESFIKSIAHAIDAKSPYTGGHVRKVAEITMIIAKALNETKEGKYKDVQYCDEELNQMRIAALMHDIGKITTPEYVVDKATKLETIYDRIESVRNKFEIIKRDLEISYLKKEITEEEFEEKVNQLNSDYQFILVSNKGGEFMADEKIERIHAIAKNTWFFNGEEQPLLTENEVYNLCIRKGTLTEEERTKINDHATMTLKMMNALPFPKKLSRVSEIAGGHHEKLNGKGYPLGLTAEQLSLESRVLALADIFEALTASDRPYKDAKKLSEVMKIIDFMVKDEELDPDLVKFFYENHLHIIYGEKELKPEQMDL
ncbi:MAG: HD domain-containing protein, partial [Campylobacterales bacterium]|nr:HD domain-containing protein [Campylobacterales bacterium]